LSSNSHHSTLQFRTPVIKGITTTVGAQQIDFKDERTKYDLDEKEFTRLQKVIGLGSRSEVIDGETTVDLSESAARKLLDGLGYSAQDLSAIILVTQTPDYTTPASAIALQHRLGADVSTMAFDVGLGCSGFVYGLSIAYSLVESGLERVLMCAGDVSSRFVDPLDHTLAPIMGDGVSAVLIERGESNSFFQMYSDGSGEMALRVPHSGLKRCSEDEGLKPFLKMDGAAVFNFTLQRVPSMIDDVLACAAVDKDQVDYFVLHQPNRYMLKNMQKRLKVPVEKLPMETQSLYGNLNSASIPSTISGFLSENYSSGKNLSVFSGFGIGLSWAACVVETDTIFAPPTYIGID